MQGKAREAKKCYSIIYGVLCIVFCQRTDNLPVVKACDLSLVATFTSPHTKSQTRADRDGAGGKQVPAVVLAGKCQQQTTSRLRRATAMAPAMATATAGKNACRTFDEIDKFAFCCNKMPRNSRGMGQAMCSHGTCIFMQ